MATYIRMRTLWLCGATRRYQALARVAFIGTLLLGPVLNALSQTITEYASGITAGLQPSGIAAGPDGNLWFTEISGSTGKVARINPGTSAITEFPTAPNAGQSAIVAGPDGNMWFTE